MYSLKYLRSRHCDAKAQELENQSLWEKTQLLCNKILRSFSQRTMTFTDIFDRQKGL